MKKKEQDLIINQVISDLYQGKKTDAKMREISLTLLWNDFGFSNLMGHQGRITEYYLCSNSKGEQGIISALCADGYNCFDNNCSIKVLFPFGQRTFYFYMKESSKEVILLTKNNITDKYGIVRIKEGKSKFLLDEKFDSIDGYRNGYIVRNGNKIGRINPDNEQYNIPIVYSDLQEPKAAQSDALRGKVELFSLDSANIIVRKNNLWGAYCYIEDSHFRAPLSDPDKYFSQKYIKKRFVPPLFEKVEFFHVDTNSSKIYLKVFLDGKQGILDVYGRSFVAPIVFDEITDCKKCEDSSHDKFIFYGYIDGNYYQYDGKVFLKKDDDIILPESYQKVRTKIAKYNVKKSQL